MCFEQIARKVELLTQEQLFIEEQHGNGIIQKNSMNISYSTTNMHILFSISLIKQIQLAHSTFIAHSK